MCENFMEILDMFEMCTAIEENIHGSLFDNDNYEAEFVKYETDEDLVKYLTEADFANYEIDGNHTNYESDTDICECILKMIEFAESALVKEPRKQKRWGVHPINQLRREYGHFEKLYNDMLMYDHGKFFNYTRMSPERFEHLLELVRGSITKKSPNAIPAKCRLLITLRFLAAGDSFLSLHYNFRVGVSTAKNIVYETCDAIWNILSPIYLKYPTEVEWMKIAQDFQNKLRLPNCVGCLDGRHIEIVCPKNSGSMYFNYLRYFSMVLLAVTDANKNFVYVDIGAYGSQSDGGIFFHSTFGQRMEQNQLNLPPPTPLPGMNIPFPYFFLGDAAFPLNENLQTPYAGTFWSLDETQFNYNNEHSSVRKGIENGFGILVNRWRIYTGPIDANPDNVNSIIKATVVLHNFIKSFNDEASIRYLREERDELPLCSGPRRVTETASGGNGNGAAYAARDYYANYLMNSV